MPKMPIFATEEELAQWVDTHDTAPYMDDMEDVEETFNIERTPSENKMRYLRVNADLVAAIEEASKRLHVSSQDLVETWLREKLQQETHAQEQDQ